MDFNQTPETIQPLAVKDRKSRLVELQSSLIPRGTAYLKDVKRPGPQNGSFHGAGSPEHRVLSVLRSLAEGKVPSQKALDDFEQVLKQFERWVELNERGGAVLRGRILSILEQTFDFCRKCGDEMRPPNGYKYPDVRPNTQNGALAMLMKRVQKGEIVTQTIFHGLAVALERIDFVERAYPRFVIQLSEPRRHEYAELVKKITSSAIEAGFESPWSDSFASGHLHRVLSATAPAVDETRDNT